MIPLSLRRLALVGVLFAALIAAAPALHAREGCVSGVPAPGPTAPPSAPSTSLSGRGITVAVIDTGVTPHPQLAEVLPGSDFVSPESPAPLLDCDGHGTVVAGLIASRDAGVAPGVTILSIRQTTTAPTPSREDHARGTLSSLAKAVEEAVDRGARVINLSVVACLLPERARRLDTTELDAALDRAERSGAVVVAAAGNRSPQCEDASVVYPAYSPTVLSVGALDSPHDLAAYSLPGGPLRLATPGTVSAGLSPTGEGWVSAVGVPDPSGFIASPQDLIGTSFAAPIVSGIAALVLERAPHYSPAEVRTLLLSATQPPHGAVTPQAVLSSALPPPPPRPHPSVTLTGPPDSRARSRLHAVLIVLIVATAGTATALGVTHRRRPEAAP
ncbi:S8 family serine peptidase [Corynebacterium mastitidis]|uniref:S8 family serine peptidase n=1 Tax=Corynebacterium mastitidis TaxID=161890 RepID=A0ABU8NX21_9CORY